MADNDNQAAVTEAPVDGTTDKVELQTSEASEQQTNTTPEVTQEESTTNQGEVDNTEVKTEDKVKEEQLIAGKFKSVEDLEKSYRELESKFGKEASEKAELTKILNEAFVSPDTGDSSSVIEASDYGIEESNDNSVIEDLQRKTSVQSFILAHPDASPQEMQKVLAEDPLVGQINGYDGKLEYAYLKSQTLNQPKVVAEAEKQAIQQTQSKIVEKQTAQVESAQKAEVTDEKAELKAKATQGTPDERKGARLDYIRKYLV